MHNRVAREALAAKIERELGPFDPLHLAAVIDVPRERFVRPEDLARSCEDAPLPLDAAGFATISAPHAYLLSYRLVALRPGDALLELGTGTGYGAALASYIVGAAGRVVTLEIDEALAGRARSLLADRPNVTVYSGDAMHAAALVGSVPKTVVTFAVAQVPSQWVASLRDGAVLAAPVGPLGGDQRLLRMARHGSEIGTSEHGAVRYVPNRSRESSLRGVC